MATRTAPAVTGATQKVVSTVHLVDASGDTYTASFITATAPVAADLEAMVAAYQLATQASIWQVSQSLQWLGVKETNNADQNIRYQVDNGINLLFRTANLLGSNTTRLVAPVPAAMDGADDIPIVGANPVLALTDAITALTGDTFESGQYTTHRERKNNPRRGV